MNFVILKLNVVFSLIVTLILLVHIWPHRKSSAVKILATTMSIYSLWSFWVLATFLSEDLPNKILFTKVRMIANPFLTPLWASLITYIFYREFWRKHKAWLLVLYIIPLITSVCAIASTLGSPWAESMMSHSYVHSSEGRGLMAYEIGFIQRNYFRYAMLVMLGLNVVYLLNIFSKDRRSRRYSRVFLLGGLFVIPVEFYVHSFGGIYAMQLTAGTSWILATFAYYGITRYEFFDIKSMAHQQILESLPNPVLAVTPGNELYEANKEAERIFALSEKNVGLQLTGKNFDFLKNMDQNLVVDESIYKIFRHEFALNRSGDRASVFVLSDVTELEESNALLRNLHQEILKMTEFTHNVQKVLSHDMSGVLSNLNILLRATYSDILKAMPGSELENRTAKMLQASASSLELLRNVLAWSHEDDGSRLVDVHACLNRSLAQLAWQAEEKKLTWNLELSPEVGFLLGSKHRLEAIFRNILSNAVKHSHHEGIIHIRSRIVGETLFLQIRDEGTGMSPILLESLRKGEDPIHDTRGVGYGVGLRFTREFIRVFGGSLEINSNANMGTEIRVSFPIVNIQTSESSYNFN